MDSKRRMLAEMRDQELLHEYVFRHLSAVEKNSELKRILRRLSVMEGEHAAWWQAILEGHEGMAKIRPFHARVVGPSLLSLRRVLGVALTVKILERFELNSYVRFNMMLSRGGATKKELGMIEHLRKIEERMERPLENKVISYGSVLNNVRDVTFGMNDGLVEVLAAATGLGAALSTATLVFMAGFIVAVSGTLSMSAGAYLATNYEQTIGSGKSLEKSASKSAYYVGAFYFIGALFPLAPFAFGIGGYQAILMSTAITVLVLSAVSALIAVVSDVRIVGSIAKTLAISLAAVVVTVLLGTLARSVLHINI